MPKILHTARYTGKPWNILQSVVPDGFTIETLEELSCECLLRQSADADYLLVSGRLPINERLLTVAKHLKMIQRTGVGTEMLDIDAIRRHSIPVYVNVGVNARSVAEHTLTLILCCLKNIPQIDRNTKQGIWKKQQTGVTCNELYGKTVGLVGMGAIGRQVARYLNAFGAKLLYTDIVRTSQETEKELSLTYLPTFQALLPLIDILSFHCPLTSENREMLNSETLKMLKEGVMVVNTARGKLIEPKALYTALCEGKIRSAALDVHHEEPFPMEYSLTKLENVILTPHIGGLSFEAFYSMMTEAMENIKAFEKKQLEKIEKKRLI